MKSSTRRLCVLVFFASLRWYSPHSMQIVLLLYLAFFVALSAATVVDDLRSKAPKWETLADIILPMLAFTGMVLYIARYDATEIKLAWKLIGPLIAVGYIVSIVVSRRRVLEAIPEEELSLVPGGEDTINYVTAFLLLPAAVARPLVFDRQAVGGHASATIAAL